LRIGLAGCGRWGTKIARDLHALNLQLEIADPVTGTYASARELPPCDAYVIATPATTHASVLEVLLPHGKPVFCEKPLGTSARELEALPAAARELVFVMDKWRYHRAIERLGRLAADGSLGALAGIATRRLDSRDSQADVDCTWTLLPHELAIVAEIAGRAPVAAAAAASSDGGRVVGLVSHLRAGDAYAVSTISVRSPARVRAVEVIFADGTATFGDDDEATITLASRDAGSTEKLGVAFVPPLRCELEAFVAYAAGTGAPPKSTFTDGVDTVRTIEQLRALARA